MFDLGNFLTAGLLFSAFSLAIALSLVVAENLRGRAASRLEAIAPLAMYGGAALATWLAGQHILSLVAPLAAGLIAAAASFVLIRGFTVPGRIFLVANTELMLFGLPWGIWFIATVQVSELTRALMFAAYPLVILTVPAALVQTFEQWERLCRRSWSRPWQPLAPAIRERYPKVSLHVPACSEPPEVVIATLDSLARLRYPNFEVLVIDNNTADPELWRPVDEHCRRLGERFRFFHLERWPGAKAGALNFALGQASDDAEIVGVVDSDYVVEPGFLEELIGHLDDPKIGFVQTPHAYRDWKNNKYLRMCAWEYRYFFETTMRSLNECGAGITVGTMCLIRRCALEGAGGWAEWCATEDSELAIRIHALGYSSIYVNTVFGRGLIPETFSGYKRQRFRWTSGPVQELKEHFRLFLPWPLRRRSALTLAQKVHHLNHGLDRLAVGLRLLFLPVAAAVIVSMIAQREVVSVPMALWVAATVSLAGEFVHWWLAYRVTMRCSLNDTIGALIASKALHHTITVSSLSALFVKRIPWRRTNKFKVRPSLRGPLAAWPELLLGLGALAFAAAAYAGLPQRGLVLMLVLGAVYQGLNYLSAPALALLAEIEVRRRRVLRAPSTPTLLLEPVVVREVD